MATLSRAARAGKTYLNPVPTTVGGLSMALKVLPRYFANRAERTPAQPLGPFRTDASLYTQPPAGGLRVTWFGHSSSLLELDGYRILIDPVWEQFAAPVQWFGPRRFYSPTLALAELPPVDIVLISHDHYDHLGAHTTPQLAAAQPQARWVTARDVGPLLQRFGVPAASIHQLDWTESFSLGALTITALPARHFSGRSLFNRYQTLWASFALGTARHRVFYGADSGEWEGFQAVGQTHGPFDLSMLEIGAFDPRWASIHMGPDGALRTFKLLGGQGLLMPIHWGLFDLALHAWRQPIERLYAAAAGTPLWSPRPGVPAEVIPNTALHSHWWR